MRIVSKDKPQPLFVKGLVYSDPGIGKTLWCATAADVPEMNKVAFINTDRGTFSLPPEVEDKLTIFEPGLNDDGSRNGNTLKEIHDLVFKIVSEKKFNTIILDGATELQSMSLEDVAETVKSNEINMQVYMKESRLIKNTFRMLRDAPVHVIVTALVKRDFTKPKKMDESPTLTAVRPEMTASVANAVQGFMNFVFYMYKDEDEGTRKFCIENMGKVKAKTRNSTFYSLMKHDLTVDSNPMSKILEFTKKSKETK
jgi:hypothetical protein